MSLSRPPAERRRPPTAGRLAETRFSEPARIDHLSGRRLARWRSRHIGFVFQLYRLLPVLTAEKNVELALLLTPLSRADRRHHVATALAVVSLQDRAQHYPRQLSGGQELRVGIARAIVTDPTLLLCDEPTGDPDRQSGDEILDLLPSTPSTARRPSWSRTTRARQRGPGARCTSPRGCSPWRPPREVPASRLAQPAAPQGPHHVHATVESRSPSSSSATCPRFA